MKYQPPKGTQDLWGDTFYAYDTIARTILKITEQYGFRQMRTPGFESIEILAKDAGSEVMGQIYAFTDKAGRELGIKSDITPAVTRFIAGNSRPMSKPIKVVCYDRVYRYESPQSGRNREITQINGELFGAKAGPAEAEVLACMYQCYTALGLPEVMMQIGYRPLLVDYLRGLNTDEAQLLPLIRLIDKKDKITPQVFAAEAAALGVDKDGLAKIALLLSLEGPFAETTKKARQLLTGDAKLVPYIEQLEDLAIRLDQYGIAQQCRLNLGLARGSDYYTGLIWEAKLPGSAFGSIGGGGRYDNLVADYGGPDTAAIGWSIGLDRLYLVLEELRRLEAIIVRPRIDYYLATERDPLSVGAMTSYAQKLRREGKNVELDLLGKNMSEQLQTAKALGADKVLLFKQESLAAGQVLLLDLATNAEKIIKTADDGHRNSPLPRAR